MQVYKFSEWKLENCHEITPSVCDIELPTDRSRYSHTIDEFDRPFYGDEFGRNFAYYGSDDEDLTDQDEFDLLPSRAWDALAEDEVVGDIETGN